MRVFFTLFCEHVSEGSYGRINLIGILPQKQIAIPHLRYVFKGYLVVWVSSETAKVNKKLNFYNPNNTLISSFDFPEHTDDDLEKSIYFPVNWPIDKLGEYLIEILFEDGEETYKREFNVVIGPAASLNLETGEIPPQIVLGGNDQIHAREWFKKIFRRAKKTILVIDNFWTTKELEYLLSEIKPEIKLVLFVKDQERRKKDTENVKLLHANTDIKTSTKIHDRYICLDEDSEIWQIGSSLNHAGGNIMTINKLTSIEAIQKLKSEVNNIFPDTFRYKNPEAISLKVKIVVHPTDN